MILLGALIMLALYLWGRVPKETRASVRKALQPFLIPLVVAAFAVVSMLFLTVYQTASFSLF